MVINKLTTLENKQFYKKRRDEFKELYWSKKPENLAIPNGFQFYPSEIYDQFALLMTRAGKVLDLGCGNGLLLKHLVRKSRNRLIPYGVDFLKKSITEAKKVVLPKCQENFTLCNFLQFDFAGAPFDYILLDPDDVHPFDWKIFLKRVALSLSSKGIIIFYTYADSLTYFEIEWVGERRFLKKLKLKRIDGKGVSFAIYQPK